jgi:hypothetical protein
MIPRALLQASGSLTASEVVTVILVAKLVTRCLRRRLPVGILYMLGAVGHRQI